MPAAGSTGRTSNHGAGRGGNASLKQALCCQVQSLLHLCNSKMGAGGRKARRPGHPARTPLLHGQPSLAALQFGATVSVAPYDIGHEYTICLATCREQYQPGSTRMHGTKVRCSALNGYVAAGNYVALRRLIRALMR